MRSNKPTDSQEMAVEEILRRKVAASLADSRPSVSAEDVFQRLRAHHAEQLLAQKRVL